MEESLNLKLQRKQAFKLSLGEIRPKLAVANGLIILLAVGVKGVRSDYLICFSYLTWSLFWSLVPALKRWGTKLLRLPLLLTDLAVTGYMISRTGGLNSELVFFLFLPVVVAAVRCRLPGIIAWASIMALLLTGVSWLTRTLSPVPLLIKIAYIYLAGILGGVLIQRTYSATETVSEKLVQLNTRLQKLNSFSQEVSGSSDLDGIFNQIIKAARQSIPDALVAVTLFDESGELKIWDSSWEDDWLAGYELHPLTRRSITLAPVLVFRKPLLDTDITKHSELVKAFRGIPADYLNAFPIIIAGEVAGVLMVATSGNQSLPESEVQILTGIATQAGLALQNIASLNEAKQQADTDGLTGLYNRRYFNEKLDELVDLAIADGSFLSLIMMDVDNFKHYNDTFGHPAGDQLLKTVAGVVSDAVREGDIVARYGGEEFAVILKNSSRETALQIAERIRISVANIPLGTLKTKITISLGVGTLPTHARDRNGLVEFADQSLYFSKQSGKNRVSCGFQFKSSIRVKNH
ncbi:MAG: diguanylate cyclase [Firmicutes bacterium]|nr:diguanylate cyclase [Bacillota bacterium]